MDVPDQKGRLAILKVHAKNKKLSDEIDLSQIAMRTPGFSGADLANLLNEVLPCAFSFRSCYIGHVSRMRKQDLWLACGVAPWHTPCIDADLMPPLSQRWHALMNACIDAVRFCYLQAAILTGRRSKQAITNKEVDDSVDRIVAGMEGTPMTDGKAKSLVAYHEVGHAVCGTLTPGHDAVQKVC